MDRYCESVFRILSSKTHFVNNIRTRTAVLGLVWVNFTNETLRHVAKLLQ